MPFRAETISPARNQVKGKPEAAPRVTARVDGVLSHKLSPGQAQSSAHLPYRSHSIESSARDDRESRSPAPSRAGGFTDGEGFFVAPSESACGKPRGRDPSRRVAEVGPRQRRACAGYQAANLSARSRQSSSLSAVDASTCMAMP